MKLKVWRLMGAIKSNWKSKDLIELFQSQIKNPK
jgi:hypothetical protein